ncbi:hypothetical protein T439DRAFT_348604 [Meredithblackwellia eburnea MCA 4105]
MLESVIAPVLNRFLSTYVVLETQQLNIGILSGPIRLRNVRLRKDALDKFRLPIDVLEGYVGDLTINISFKNLNSEPVRILISDVFLLAVPTESSKATPEEDEARAQAAKMEKLANAELMSGAPGGPGMSLEDERKNETFIASLTTKVIDNLQVEVRNIHIRYEDKLSVPGHPFAVGFTLAGFSAVSTDEFWRPAFVTNSRAGIHKLAKLESLAVYFDTDSESLAGYPINEAIAKFNELIARKDRTPEHQFILKPVSGEGRLILNKKVDGETPKMDVELLFQELGFALDADQYRDALSMVDLFHFYTRQREYRKFRPPQALIDENRNKALWRFALDAIRTEVHEKNRKWSWKYFAERRDDRKDYVRLFKASGTKGFPPDDAKKLAELEKKLGYKDIRFYRSIARSELRKEKKQHEEEERLHPRPANTGWVAWATGWGAAKPAGESEEDGDGTGGLNETQRKELYQAIDWDEKQAVASAVDMPKEALLLRAKAKLETGSFALRTDPHGKNADLISLNFDDFQLDLNQRPDNFDATLALGGLRVFDGTLPGSLHPQIVRVKADKAKERQKSKIDYKPPEEREADEDEGQYDHLDHSGTQIPAGNDPFFSLKFEHNPLDERADNALEVRLRHMEVIYHRGYVEEIFKFFKPPESQLESVGALIDVASSTLEGIRKETRAGLEFALTQHKTVDLHLDLNAPIIIIPESVTEKNCQHVVLDAGHISVRSELADENAMNAVKAKERQEYQDEDYQRLEGLMYDKFHVNLDDAQLLLGPSLQVCLDSLSEEDSHASGGELHILERTSLSFLAQNCILSQAPNLTRFKVSGSLPTIQVNISDRKYKSMMRMIDVALPKFDDSAPARPALAPHATSTFGQSARPAVDDDAEYHLEATAEESESESEAEEDEVTGKEEFFDPPDIADGKNNIHQKTFEFTFQVDRVQASIFRSALDPKQPDRLLANAVLESFRFEFALRPYDMSVDILLRSLYVEDKMVDDDTEFRHLVTSKQLEDASENGQVQDLVRIRYQGVQKTSPEFMTVHDAFDKAVDVEMSTLNVVFTRGSILILFDWVMTTFTDPDAATPPPSPEAIEGEDPQIVEVNADKLRVNVKLTSINAVLNEDGFRLATLSLSAADVSVVLRAPTMRVAARLGNLTFVDDFSADTPTEMLSIQGDELLDFQYETYDPSDHLVYPGYDSLVHLRSGSLQFTFIEEPVHRLLLFFSKFAKMKQVYDSAAAAAAQRAVVIQESIPKMHYDILVRTPIVIFPHDEIGSKDVIVANLGEISLKNAFKVSSEKVVTSIKAGLSAIHLATTLHHEGEPYQLQILDDVTINVDVTLTQMVNPDKVSDAPATQVVAKMTDVKMGLTQAQYKLTMSLLQTIPRAFSFSDEEMEDDVSSMPTPPTAPVNAPAKAIEAKPEETVDLLPELATVAKGADGKVVPLKSSLELVFGVKKISLELFTAAAAGKVTLKDASLARFSLNDTGVKYKMLTNGSMEAEVVLRSFTVHDTRPARQTKFREIIPATSHSGHQFMVNYTQSGGTDRSSFANVTIDTPTLIFSLDPLFALLDYFMSAFPSKPSSPTPAPADDTESSSAVSIVDPTMPARDPNAPTFAFRVNIVSPQIKLLDDPERNDSEAVVLSIDQVLMSQQGTLALTINQVGMFLCRMNNQSDKIRFMDNLDLTVSLDSRTDGGRQVTAIEVGVQPVVLRVSFRDILLISNIVNRAIELSNRSAGPPPEPAPSAPIVSKPIRSRQDPSRGSMSHHRRRSSAATLQAQVIITKETLKATIDGFQLILIGDMHDLPVLDIKAPKFSAKASDWSSELKAAVTIAPFINYFNLRVSHWEPLMDAWQFSIHVARSSSTGPLKIGLESEKRLELNVTSTFIELAMTTAALMGKEGDKVFTKARGANAPFLIKNRTGYSIALVNGASTNKAADTARIEDGADLPWRFDDWRTMRENISATSHNSLELMFENMSWERTRHIFVDREGEHIYTLKPKVDEVTHRFLCEIKLVDNVKVITFRSTFLVENRSMVPTEVVIVDNLGKKASQIYKIPPGQDCAMPILDAYHNRIRIRPEPGFGYAWSTESYHWKDLIKRPTRAIVCKSNTEAAFRYQAYAIQDKQDPLTRRYPRVSLRLRAPVEIQNLLPHDVCYRVFDKNLEHNWTSYLRQGLVSPIHVAELSHLLLLSVEIQDSVFKRSEFSIINTDNPEDLPVENELVMQDKDGLTLNVRLNYQNHADSGGAFRVQIYSPYIFINKTGIDFALKYKAGVASSAKNVAGQQIFAADHKRKEEVPFMFSGDKSTRVLLRIGESAWSQSLTFETVGVETEVVIPSASGEKEIHVGLKVTEGLGDYKLTKVVTIYPRFVVINNTGQDIRIRENGSTEPFLLARDDRHFLGFLRVKQEPQLSLSFPGAPGGWSAPFNIQEIGQTFVRVQGAQESLVKTDISLEGAIIFIRLDLETKNWPFLIRNESDTDVFVTQSFADDARKIAGREAGNKYTVAARSTLPYAWDQPAIPAKHLRIDVGGREQQLIDVMEIGSQPPFRAKVGSETRVLSIEVRAEGPAQVIRLSNYNEEDSVFKLQRRNTETLSRQNSVALSRDGTFEAVEVKVESKFELHLGLEGIGISVVNKQMKEIVYASFRGLTASYEETTTSFNYELGIKWIQVDNQLFGSLYPIILYPSVIPKTGKELDVHPCLTTTLTVLKDDSHGVTYIKYATILLQEMSVELDEDFIVTLLDFAKFSGATGQAEVESKLTAEPAGIPKPKGTSAGGEVYFELLHLQPIQLNLSLMRTDRINGDDQFGSHNPLFFIFNALLMAIGNVNDAQLRLNGHIINNMRLSPQELQDRLFLHYRGQVLYQIYRVLGSADFIGNPVGLFSNVSSGVMDFFVQPYDSIVMNGNMDIGFGIARGAGSLAKKTVYGLSDSVSKVTGSISKGLSAATLDRQYQSERRMRHLRNRPKHALYGVTAGATTFVTSVASGFEGLATKPLEGAETEGAAGFFKGVGRGIIGVVTKPAVGFFDMASTISEGIRNTTTVFDQTSLDRVRLPRFTASDGILRPYTEREALGQKWLKDVENGKYFNETYVAHLDLPTGPGEEAFVVILTTTRILLVKVVKLKTGWDVPFSDLQTISLEANGISLVMRRGVQGPFLAIPSASARLWLFRHLERVVSGHNARKTADQ